MPPNAWLVLLLICTIIAAAGAMGLSRLQQRRHGGTGRQFPLSGVTLITGPLVGLVLGAISYVIAPNDWEPIDVREQFETIMTFSTGAGCLVAVIILLIVDLPRRHRLRSVDSDDLTTDGHD
jgi:hypothetical protein